MTFMTIEVAKELDVLTNFLIGIRYGEIVDMADSSPYSSDPILNEAYWAVFYIFKGEPEAARNFFDRFRREVKVYRYRLIFVVKSFDDAYDNFCKEFEDAMDVIKDLGLKDKLIFGYEDAFNRIVELVDDIMTWDKDELNIDFILGQCKRFDKWTKTITYPPSIWYKDVTDRAVDCIRGYLVGFDMTHVFGNFMNTVTAHSDDGDIPKEAKDHLKRLIHTLWVLTYGDELDFNSIETKVAFHDSDLYQKEALRTESGMLHGGELIKRLENGLMGLNGEAGECIDILKKHLFQGHPLDFTELAEELGDVAWYLAVSANAIGYDLSDIFSMNIEKLKKRYPDGFEVEKSVNRTE